MNILELDLGNTRCKWRYVAAGVANATDAQRAPVKVLSRGAFATSAWHDGELPAEWAEIAPARVRAANVAGERVATAVREYFLSRLNLEPEFAAVSTRCGGVTCAYEDVSRLGVDRWLAVLAAHHRNPAPSLVVDCGSAVTLDLLGRNGRHLGGYIVPGLALMRRALFQDTDAVKVAADLASGASLAPGRDTDSAVNRGLPLMVLGAIDAALQQLKMAIGEEAPAALGNEPSASAPTVWLTGGDSAFLGALLPAESVQVEDLVLDGLALTNP